MGAGLSLSGVSNTGHDVDGFSGPAPSPELLLRWVQFGIFMPRFAINFWNDDGTLNEPWMYPEIPPHVSRLLKLRYRLMLNHGTACFCINSCTSPMTSFGFKSIAK